MREELSPTARSGKELLPISPLSYEQVQPAAPNAFLVCGLLGIAVVSYNAVQVNLQPYVLSALISDAGGFDLRKLRTKLISFPQRNSTLSRMLLTPSFTTLSSFFCPSSSTVVMALLPIVRPPVKKFWEGETHASLEKHKPLLFVSFSDDESYVRGFLEFCY